MKKKIQLNVFFSTILNFHELRIFSFERKFGNFSLIFLVFLTILSCQEHEKKEVRPVNFKLYENQVIEGSQNIDSLKNDIEFYKGLKNNEALILSYQKLGKTYFKQGLFSESIDAHTKELQIALDLGDTIEITQALNFLGKAYKHAAQYNKALRIYYHSLSYCNNYSEKDNKSIIINKVELLKGIGSIFLAQKNWKIANSALRTALKNNITLNNPLGKASNFEKIGYIFASTGQNDSAWSYYNKALESYALEGSETGIALCHMHFGELYEKETNLDKALYEYLMANEAFAITEDKYYWVESCIHLSQIFFQRKEEEKALQYLDKAKIAAYDMGAIKYISDIHFIYYKYYIAKGDSQRALENYTLNRTFTDSILNLNKLNGIFNTHLQHLQDKYQTELQIVNENYENEKFFKRIAMILFIVVSCIIFTIIFLMYRYLHIKRRFELAKKNMERMKDEFFTNITHEFRTPLTIILGFSKQLEEEKVPTRENLLKIGSMITYQGNQLLSLVNQLLDIPKLRSSLGRAKWNRGNIIAYLEMLVESYQETARRKHNELVFLSKEKIVEMDFVADYMNKIMRNLLSNAFKFTPEYGRIYITASADKHNLNIFFADNGQGISEEDKPHLFNAFYQGRNKSSYTGTGIGLSLVQQLVLAMDGTIDVKSSINEGTVFIIKIPLKHGYTIYDPIEMSSEEIPAVEENIQTKSEELPVGKNKDDGTPLILIIEDNMDIAYYIGTRLQQKYTLKYARNGKIGIDLAENLIPDLIISDIIMPEMDGYAVCRSIRKSENTNHIPIIIISVLNTEEERRKGLEAGADVYMNKPFNSIELNERVDYLLKQRHILRHKYGNKIEKHTEQTEINDSDEQFLNKLTDITYSVMASGNVTVENIATKMLISRQQLNRKIQSLTGENAVNYLMQIRLNKAKMLLDSPQNILISEIALKCGFEDTAYFSRIFKKTFNITPTQYRRRIKD